MFRRCAENEEKTARKTGGSHKQMSRRAGGDDQKLKNKFDARDVTFRRGMRMKIRIPALLALLWAAMQLTVPGGVHAAPLNLTRTYPDFNVVSLSYSYNATTGILTVGQVENNAAVGGNNDWMCNPGETCTGTGTVGSYSAAASPSPQLQVTDYPITGSTYKELFSLYANLNTSGSVLGGTFRVDGVVRTNGFPVGCTANTYSCVLYDGSTVSGGLLSGNLTQFGWSVNTGSNGILEFRFDNASGLIGSQGLGFHGGGMILTVSSSTLTNFGAQALTTSWTGTGYGDVFVPIPAAAWLFGSGLLALLGVARRKTRQ